MPRICCRKSSSKSGARHRATTQSAAVPEAWIVNITRSRAIDKLRSIRRREQSFVFTADPAAAESADNVETNVAESEAKLTMNSALANLPEAQRRVLELAYFDGLSQSEIAARLEGTAGHGENQNAQRHSASKDILERKQRNGYGTRTLARAQSDIYALGALDGEELQDFQAHLAIRL